MYLSFMEKPNEMSSKIEELNFEDGELRLRFCGRKQATEPDTEISVYHFSMVNSSSHVEMGGINIRAGYTENIVRFRGNVGFTVHEKYRGNHYSARSCRLLIPVFSILDLNPVWFTCNVDNIASRKNIERIGATYIETIMMPEGYSHRHYYPEGARVKMRFKWDPI
jgi:predicted acetyltransferase